MNMTRPISERSKLRPGDLIAEAMAGMLQRPSRSILTALGTVLGVGAFVAVLGLASTATGQIGSQFSVLADTTVTVTDIGDGHPVAKGAPAAGPASDFPEDADHQIDGLNGVRSSGVYWTVPLSKPIISARPAITATSSANVGALPMYAASPGLFQTIGATVVGTSYGDFHQDRGERVAVLGSQAAKALGVTRLDAQPAIFVNGVAFTVVGIMTDVVQLPSMLLGIMIPSSTAAALYAAPIRQ